MKMGILQLFLSCGILFFTGCDKNNDEIDSKSVVLTDNTIRGTIDDFSNYSHLFDSLYITDVSSNILTTCKVNTDGSFAAILPTPPPPTSLVSVSAGIPSKMFVSDAKAKICWVNQLLCFKNSAPTNCSLEFCIFDSNQTTQIVFIYCDRYCNVLGTSVQTYKDNPNTYTTTMNFSLSRGWNTLSVVILEKGLKSIYTNSLPVDPIWVVNE